ncbi:MAG: hypothetical protein KF773_12220 [Deltaproteobacteria bacterium]|nr:hypothetical protein [Deltaproteobacteria bacterium]
MPKPKPPIAWNVLRAPLMRGLTCFAVGVMRPVVGLATRRVRQVPFSYDPDRYAQLAWKKPKFDGTTAVADTFQSLKNNPADYRAGVAQATHEIWQAAHAAAQATYPDLTSPAARGTVLVASSPRPEGGHAAMTVTLVPHEDPASVVASPNGLRHAVAGFPGGAAELPPGAAVAIARARICTGTSVNALDALRLKIAAYNAKQLQSAAPLDGAEIHLGGNSMVKAADVATIDLPGGGKLLRGLLRTTLIHSQDGIADWKLGYHPSIPKTLLCMSDHLGHNPIPGGDEANVALAPALFHVLFRTGALIERHFAELADGLPPEQAAQLTRDPTFRARLLDVMVKEDPDLYVTWQCIRALDVTGGAKSNGVRLFWGGDAIATLDAAELDSVPDSATDPAGAAAAVANAETAGVTRTVTDGYTGGPSVTAADPTAVVVAPSDVATSNVLAASNPDNSPFLPDVQPYADAVATAGRAAMADLQDPVDAVITRESRAAFANLSDADRTARGITDQATALLGGELRDNLRTALHAEVVLPALSALPAFAAAAKELDEEAEADDLVDITVTEPLWTRMTAGADGTSYLTSRVVQALAQPLAHALAEEAPDLQERFADADQHYSDTVAERKAKSQALDEVQAQLKADPGNPALKAQEQQLVDALAKAVEDERAAEDARNAAEDAQQENADRAKDVAPRSDAAEASANEHEGAVFSSGGS